MTTRVVFFRALFIGMLALTGWAVATGAYWLAAVTAIYAIDVSLEQHCGRR